MRPAVVIVVVLLVIWMVYLLWKLRRMAASNDANNGENRWSIDVVIARYEESLAWLSNEKIRDLLPRFRQILVYNKGRTPIEASALPPNARVIPLPNVGRCDHTYLHHILTHYHAGLAEVTVFLPASFDRAHKWPAVVHVLEESVLAPCSVFPFSGCSPLTAGLVDMGIDRNFQLDDWRASHPSNSEVNGETRLRPNPSPPDTTLGNGFAGPSVPGTSLRQMVCEEFRIPADLRRRALRHLQRLPRGHSPPTVASVPASAGLRGPSFRRAPPAVPGAHPPTRRSDTIWSARGRRC